VGKAALASAILGAAIGSYIVRKYGLGVSATSYDLTNALSAMKRKTPKA
jgi:hypothetical protein